METNALPKYDTTDNPTNCCPRFHPENWEDQKLHFKDKLFVKAKTKSILHMPINMGKVYPKTITDIQTAHALSDDDFIVLSYDPSPWFGEHYFAVNKNVPNHEMTNISGEFLTKVFEGAFRNAPRWLKAMEEHVKGKGYTAGKTYFFFTTCPKCAKVYGKNYVVAVSEIQNLN